MAEEFDDAFDDAVEEDYDNAGGLTSGIIIMTFVILLAALIVQMMANGGVWGVGPMA